MCGERGVVVVELTGERERGVVGPSTLSAASANCFVSGVKEGVRMP